MCRFSADVLQSVKFIQEKKLIGLPAVIVCDGGPLMWTGKYFEEVALDTGRYCFGVAETLKAMEQGAVETLIVWENLTTMRYDLKKPNSEEIVVRVTMCNVEDFNWARCSQCMCALIRRMTRHCSSTRRLVFEIGVLDVRMLTVVQTSNEMEVLEKMPLIEWLANNYKRFGAVLEIVTDRTQEGAQFCMGFGGIGGLCSLHF